MDPSQHEDRSRQSLGKVSINLDLDNQERAFPRNERRSVDSFPHVVLSNQLVFGVLGPESEEVGRVLLAEHSLREMYPDIPVIGIQYLRDGIEQTTFLCPEGAEQIKAVCLALLNLHITIKTNGDGPGQGRVVTIDEPITGAALGEVMAHLSRPSSIDFIRLENPFKGQSTDETS